MKILNIEKASEQLSEFGRQAGYAILSAERSLKMPEVQVHILPAHVKPHLLVKARSEFGNHFYYPPTDETFHLAPGFKIPTVDETKLTPTDMRAEIARLNAELLKAEAAVIVAKSKKPDDGGEAGVASKVVETPPVVPAAAAVELTAEEQEAADEAEDAAIQAAKLLEAATAKDKKLAGVK